MTICNAIFRKLPALSSDAPVNTPFFPLIDSPDPRQITLFASLLVLEALVSGLAALAASSKIVQLESRQTPERPVCSRRPFPAEAKIQAIGPSLDGTHLPLLTLTIIVRSMIGAVQGFGLISKIHGPDKVSIERGRSIAKPLLVVFHNISFNICLQHPAAT